MALKRRKVVDFRGWFSRVSCTKLKNDQSQSAYNKQRHQEAACMSKELLTKLRHKKEVYKLWKQRRMNEEIVFKYVEIGLGKSKSTWSWIWQGMWKPTEKACTGIFIAIKKKPKENVGIQLNWTGDLEKNARKRPRYLIFYFPLFLIVRFLFRSNN